MTRRKCVVSAACLLLLALDVLPADRKELNPAVYLGEIKNEGTAYDLKLTVADTGETFQRKGGLDPLLRLAFRSCFSVSGKGAFTAVVRLPATGEEFTLHTNGLTEDLFMVKTFPLEKPFAKWCRKALAGIKNSPDVSVEPLPELSKDARRLDPVPDGLLPAVAVAVLKYEEKRPEVFLRARKCSLLHYPSAGKTRWAVDRDGDRLFVTAFCADLMWVSRIRIELRKVEDEWEYVRLRAEEVFKGE